MRVLLLALTLGLLGGCDREKLYGKSDYYDQHIPEIPVTMPANAPYISEQYRNDSSKQHLGIDIWAKLHTPVLAAAPGVVQASFYEPAYGNRIVLSHGIDDTGAERLTVYKHLKTRQVEPGTRVARGQQIGTMGATGALGMAVHLHFETLTKARIRGEEYSDPHLHWVQGVGRVTCFDPKQVYPTSEFRTTYPVKCR
ncbi:M23 family metallopeptidase [Rhodobacteraceae bacterium M382]|nr:M23 family metallopeptidase [Rhodobacteraceae bacterium M382]